MPGEREALVRGVTVAEMKAFNTETVTSIVKGVTVAELQSINPDVVRQITDSAKITEMKLTVDGQEKVVKLTDVQGIIDGNNTKIAELQDKLTKSTITELKGRLIAELVPEQYREKVAPRIAGTDETSIKASIESEVAFIKEIAGVQFDNVPRGKGQHTAGDDMSAKMKNLFGVKEKAADKK